MKYKVLKAIEKYNLINSKDNIVLGLSGGPDSLALFYVLKELQENLDFTLHAAHVNHLIRGEESDKDEEYVMNICKRYNIPFYSRKIDVKRYAKEHRLSEEEAGREIRYNFFNNILNKLGKGKIAVAHNKNDQAETVIMRFMRGTGIDGLKGMDYQNGNIIRPLLGVTRDEIERFCKDVGIEPRIDKTNLEPIYGRNKIRLELIPYMEENFNKSIIDTLFRMSRIIKTDSDFLYQYSLDIFKDVVINKENNKVCLDIEKIAKLHKSIQSRILRLSIEEVIKSLKGIEEKHINDIIELISKKNTGKKLDISNDVQVRISYNKLIIEKNTNKSSVNKYRYKIKINDSIYIQELNSFLRAQMININEVDLDNKTRFIRYFDYDKIKGDLLIRNRKPGDRFIPLGMNGNKKIKDFFIDEKIPREERDKIPIIQDDENILWIVGYRMSELYKITKDTKKVLLLEYKKLKEELYETGY
jgi:tRNA(Ile)-lysidine synthase